MKLGVNIDHIAVLREARKVNDPNIIDAIGIVQRAGANQITIHLREDRRHINDIDAKNIIELSPIPVNLECSIDQDIIDIVTKLQPIRATLVPERREEITTEGGLLLSLENSKLLKAIEKLKNAQIEVSLFIDPNRESIELAKKLDVEWIEFHTGKYSNIWAMLYGNLAYSPHKIEELDLNRKELKKMLDSELKNLRILSCEAASMDLKVAAGHGLNYHNVKSIVEIETIEELNIGQSIIARSIFCGLYKAVKDMKELLKRDYEK